MFNFSTLQTLKFCSSIHEFADFLGYPTASLTYLLYAGPRKLRYHQFRVSKKTGGTRKITAPNEELKLLQKVLSKRLYECYEEIHGGRGKKKTLSHGFAKNRSIVSNANVHVNRRYVFNIDIENFFPSFNFGRVRGFFIKDKNFQLDEKIATMIAQIACYENELPQGSPCSPIISNLIGHIIDIRLVRLAKKNKCTYSRYADDVTFSTNQRDFPSSLAYIDSRGEWVPGDTLNREIERLGFKVNLKKTNMQFRNSRQVATGIVVNKKLNVTREYYKKVRAMAHSLFSKGEFFIEYPFTKITEESKEGSVKLPGKLKQLDGMLNHIFTVHNGTLQKEKRHIPYVPENTGSIQRTYRTFLFYKFFHALERPLIVCEGKTDVTYIQCALNRIGGSYPLLADVEDGKVSAKFDILRLTKHFKNVVSVSEGGPGLGAIIKLYKDLHGEGNGQIAFYGKKQDKKRKVFQCDGMAHPVIFLVDNDSGANAVLKEVGNNVNRAGTFIHVIQNFYVVLTPLLQGKAETAIEDFFDDDTRSRPLNKKKLSLSDKYDPSKEYGKADFAEYVVKPNQTEINFDGFAGIFDRINAVIDDFGTKN